MRIKSIIYGEVSIEKELQSAIESIHINGPVKLEDLETLSLIKDTHPEIFDEYESQVVSVLGLFYKIDKPKSVLGMAYEVFSEAIKSEIGKKMTPVQADAFNSIKENDIFSFSAPTSAGKSHLFRELIASDKGDIVIIVPSRALISEYIISLKKLVPKNVLILQFVDWVNTNHVTRRIFVLTPERSNEVFKYKESLNIDLFLFDEAQISEERIRGVRFDALVRRADREFPNAKKVFTHPFIDNPEAQLVKHGFEDGALAKKYAQMSVGKVFLSHDKDKFGYFSPFASKKEGVLNINVDIPEEILKKGGTLFIFTSKTKVVSGEFKKNFSRYIEMCPKLTDEKSLKYIDELRSFIGLSKDSNKKSTLIDMMERGVVVHHGSLPLKARLIIESFVNDGNARICFATPTLLQGINMPFDLVWINNFRFTGSDDEKILSLKNLIGRAGRNTDKIDIFDYGYVVVEKKNIPAFKGRFKKPTKISPSSVLDLPEDELPEDVKDVVEAVKEDSFNDELQLTESQVKRIEESDLDKSIQFVLDHFFIEGKVITASKYYEIEKKVRDDINEAFKVMFKSHLRNKDLTWQEQAVLSTSIPMLLWQIQGKSFAEVLSLRYGYLSRRKERLEILREKKRGLISEEEANKKIAGLKIRLSYGAPNGTIPNKQLYTKRLFSEDASVNDIDFDRLLYDTYDYIDVVISLSLKDPLSAVFQMYYRITEDERAKSMSNYLKYGTDDSTEIWLLRYGFEYDDIQWIKNHVEEVSYREIVFKDLETLSQERREVISRYVF